jgi:DNA-binding NarL/FixJ family response regulator
MSGLVEVPAGGVSGAPTVVIADDHPVILHGVRLALTRGGFEVLAEAADGEAAVEAVLRLSPDVCLLDISMPVDGIEAATRIAEARISTKVVMLTVSDRTEDVIAALRAGAVGFLPKDTHPDRLPSALCGVMKGEAALPRTLVGRVLDEFRGFTAEIVDPVRVGKVELTSRESEILRLLHSGRSTIQISEALSLSPITVRRHISTGVAKLGVADRQAAIETLADEAAAVA